MNMNPYNSITNKITGNSQIQDHALKKFNTKNLKTLEYDSALVAQDN